MENNSDGAAGENSPRFNDGNLEEEEEKVPHFEQNNDIIKPTDRSRRRYKKIEEESKSPIRVSRVHV
jgi:hypothetical protein